MLSHIPKKYKALCAVSAAWIIWGATSVVIKVGLETLPVFTLLFFRFFLAFVVMLPFLYTELRAVGIARKDIKNLIITGFLGTTVSIGLFFVGISQTGALDATLIFSITPILEIVLAYFLLKETINSHEVFGAILALIGVVVVFLKPLLESSTTSSHSLAGNAIVVLAALGFVCFTIYSKRVSGTYSPVVINGISFLVGTLSFLPLMLYEAQDIHWLASLTVVSAGSILFLAFFSSITAFFLYEWAIRSSEVSKIGIFENIQIIASGLLAYFVLGEQLTLSLLVGGALIIMGIIYSSMNNSPYYSKHAPRHRM